MGRGKGSLASSPLLLPHSRSPQARVSCRADQVAHPRPGSPLISASLSTPLPAATRPASPSGSRVPRLALLFSRSCSPAPQARPPRPIWPSPLAVPSAVAWPVAGRWSLWQISPTFCWSGSHWGPCLAAQGRSDLPGEEGRGEVPGAQVCRVTF